MRKSNATPARKEFRVQDRLSWFRPRFRGATVCRVSHAVQQCPHGLHMQAGVDRSKQ